MFGNKIIEPQAGQIVYFPQGSSYDVNVENAAESDGCIAFNFLAPDLRESEPFVFAPKSPQVFSPLFSRAEKAWKEKRPAYEEKCLEILYAVLAALKEGAAYSPSAHKRLLVPAAEYIHEHYAEKRLYGAQREKAKRQSGAKIGQRKSRETCTIGEIAELCGIPDVFYFTRLFKKVTGVPPAKWR